MNTSSTQTRTVKRQHAARRDDIADLTTRRPLPSPTIGQLDPFLFLNHHGPQVYPPGNHGLPFGPHPHRGFETVTFILDGDIAHRDSGGHESVIEAGGVQWMTAGRGLVHEEVSSAAFKRTGGPLEVLQLWVNLPARLKMTDPRYIGLQRDHIPAIEQDEGRVRVNLISGEQDGIDGPIRSLTGVHMSTVEFSAGGRARLPAPRGRTVFLYIVRGELAIGAERLQKHALIELDDDGDRVEIEAASDAVVLYGHAQPIAEPVVAQGPFVMNTKEEIAEAIRDYHAGKFGPELA
ncbi:MAG: nuclease [Noviherbaspirillum sp.]|nr:nuclease [Noviherbaspirillum sp.]